MTRITTIPSISEAPEAARPLLEDAKKKLGSVPNLFRVIANSPAALEGYFGLTGALAKGRLDARMQERIALAVAELNGCGYCLSAHSYLGRHVAKLDDAELSANRNGASNDPKADAALRLQRQLCVSVDKSATRMSLPSRRQASTMQRSSRSFCTSPSTH